jgi:Fe2+ transport system protein B
MTQSAERKPRPSRITAIFGVPAVMALITLAGLLTALLGEGIWDALSSVALAVPIVLVLWFGLLRPSPRRWTR